MRCWKSAGVTDTRLSVRYRCAHSPLSHSIDGRSGPAGGFRPKPRTARMTCMTKERRAKAVSAATSAPDPDTAISPRLLATQPNWPCETEKERPSDTPDLPKRSRPHWTATRSKGLGVKRSPAAPSATFAVFPLPRRGPHNSAQNRSSVRLGTLTPSLEKRDWTLATVRSSSSNQDRIFSL